MQTKLSEIGNIKFENIDRYNSDYPSALLFLEKVQAFHPAHLSVNYTKEADRYYFDCFVTKLAHPDIDLTIRYSNQYKRYVISMDTRLFENVSTYTFQKISMQHNSPSNIGVLTANKILKWINYFELVYTDLKKENTEGSETIKKFKDSLEGLPVKWNSDNKSGYIDKGGIRLEFKIHSDCVSQNLVIPYYVPDTVESFIQLSDNKYEQVRKV